MNFNDKLVYNIVTYNFCMIPHSLTFLFIFGHFGLKQNPTGLQEVIQRLDKNSKTILIIKSTLERSFIMKKIQKNAFLKISVFTEYNLVIIFANLMYFKFYYFINCNFHIQTIFNVICILLVNIQHTILIICQCCMLQLHHATNNY